MTWRVTVTALCLLALCTYTWAEDDAATQRRLGYLDKPPVFLTNEPDIPLTGMGVEMPGKGVVIPAVDISGLHSDGWRKNGMGVQPNFTLNKSWVRVGALYGISDEYAVMLSIPWYRNRLRGEIGGQSASGIAEGFGNIALLGKKQLWSDNQGRSLAVTAGFELPTGKDDSIFGPDNSVTNAYYTSHPQRIPLNWQPGSGTFNGLLSVAYGRLYGRLSYVGLVATKLYTAGDENITIGDILIAGVNSTYGITPALAGSLGLTLRVQSDDNYPKAPPPGVRQQALWGTTVHGTTLYLDAAVRYTIAETVVVGFGIRTPIIKPDYGMIPLTQASVVFYPAL